ncbi:unnamed protein product [Protopolystoma xenopodis]|uniref:Uncharacterized protein n=1 Tax=Protopolystoma xenopodis TaxID=117903 RepID=A0A448WV94_9PLAT|nr:unnamed protein product [Protopolystoma xenopodis]
MMLQLEQVQLPLIHFSRLLYASWSGYLDRSLALLSNTSSPAINSNTNEVGIGSSVSDLKTLDEATYLANQLQLRAISCFMRSLANLGNGLAARLHPFMLQASSGLNNSNPIAAKSFTEDYQLRKSVEAEDAAEHNQYEYQNQTKEAEPVQEPSRLMHRCTRDDHFSLGPHASASAWVCRPDSLHMVAGLHLDPLLWIAGIDLFAGGDNITG